MLKHMLRIQRILAVIKYHSQQQQQQKDNDCMCSLFCESEQLNYAQYVLGY